MIKDSNDFIIKIIGQTSPRPMKFFHIFCNKCGSDRGYLLKIQDKRPTCNKCSGLGHKVSDETKKIMSQKAIGNQYSSKKYIKKEKVRKIRHLSTYKAPYPKQLSDAQKYIKHTIRTLFKEKIKRRRISKQRQYTFSLLGYSADEFAQHIEKLFQPGMTWENHGINGWHIDHIISDSWFNYKSFEDEDFKKSWALENLKPQWSDYNWKKGNRYSG